MNAPVGPPLKELLKKLWESGFFQSPKTLKDISEALSAQGYHPRPSSLSTALGRLVVAKGYLGRAKRAGQLVYVQKYPSTSLPNTRTKAFAEYSLHSRIKAVAIDQFEDGHFKEAIQNALVEVIDQVKQVAGFPQNSRGHELDGDDLMNHVFGCDGGKTPIIKLNALRTSLDRAEQRGIMHLFKGVVGIRDRKAHLNFVQNDPLKTIEYLSLASLLLRLIEVPDTPRA